MTLNAKQERFIQEYLVDYNATQAAIRAGYSEKTAYSQGQRLLKHVEVGAAISQQKRELMKSLKLTAEDVICDVSWLKNACLEPDESGRPRDATNAVRCLTLLGNNLGTWKKEQFEDGGVEYIVKRREKPLEDDETPANVVKLPA